MNQRLPDVRISKRGFYAMRESGFPRLHLMTMWLEDALGLAGS